MWAESRTETGDGAIRRPSAQCPGSAEFRAGREPDLGRRRGGWPALNLLTPEGAPLKLRLGGCFVRRVELARLSAMCG